MNYFNEIQALLHERAECQARINLIPYDGTPEVKENSSGKYLYIRKRIGSRLTSKYVDIYSDDLYQLLLRNSIELRELRKRVRHINKKLALLGYTSLDLSNRVIENLEFARLNMKGNIYDQAILEGVATSFPQIEDIIDNGTVYGMSASDIQKILNLKHAWEFILDNDVIQADIDYYLLCHIAKLVNEGFFTDGGRIRGVPVRIGGTSYIPPIPVEPVVKERLTEIINSGKDSVDIAIDLCIYVMKAQVFNDGNKRASVLLANHYLISHGKGLLVIPENFVPEFKEKLISYYEGENPEVIRVFMRTFCWRNF